ncbi:DNA excision repair protein ERCC-6-like [Lepisosteus oculatus]|uniref:DNA excision repair protein ERCC-6-like n=1 Tax=Lepisosteus oculatus TaxID=7918 RepID=UPI003713E0F6
MGLGKTIQTITFLSGMIVMERMRSVLLVMPNSLLENWGAELRKWTPWIKFHIFHSRYKDREGRVLEVQRKGHVLLTSFRMLINSERTLSTYRDSQFIWDCIIFDEAHMIRNSTTKTFKAAFSIPAKTRILLTGTPVQNNLQELWSLFHLACQGSLLGTYRSFRKLYENPIMRGREKDASPSEKALGLKTSESLTEMIKPYYLRRTKEDIQRESKEPNKDTVKIAQFTKKNDLVMWVHLSPLQERLYRKLINQIILRGYNDSALTDLATMKKICDHPRLFTAKEYTELQCDDEGKPDLSNGHVMKDFCENKTCHLLSKELIEESGKMTFLVALLERLRKEGNRTLVFSESRKMLDIIEQVLNERGFKMLRVDGTLTAADQRHCLITAFQNRSEYSIFLLTSQVGGLGFNLTAANRVVIVDPSWNPATDSQAVDRAYRIGQEKDVVVYRLITCGTIEEKIYRRQIFKNSLVRQTIGEDRNPIRYFSKQELEQLFTVEDTRFSSTQYHLQTIHWNQPKRNKTLDDHIAYLSTLNISGISDHGLLFSASLMENFEQESAQNQIRLQVQKAQQKIEDESLFFHHTMDSRFLP